MTDLNKYYNEKIKEKGTPSFFELDEEQINKIRNSLAFASWRLCRAMDEFKKAVDDWVNSYNK